MVLGTTSIVAGGTLPAMASLIVYNPNAVAVAVTGVQMQFSDVSGNNVPGVSPVVPPTGPGMTTVAPALSIITIGPFPIVMGSAANANSFQMVNQTGNLNPTNPQLAERPQTQLMVGAIVYGSDGSVNVAGAAGLLISYSAPPPPGYQGGFLNFAGPNNFMGGLMLGVL